MSAARIGMGAHGRRARVEIELDDGSGWRMGPDSQGGLSDYTSLSTGQRITLIAIDRGVVYFNGGKPRARFCGAGDTRRAVIR